MHLWWDNGKWEGKDTDSKVMAVQGSAVRNYAWERMKFIVTDKQKRNVDEAFARFKKEERRRREALR